ncbi:MAG: hypothetical protein ACREEM_38270 [Blastocatellia bacterium]
MKRYFIIIAIILSIAVSSPAQDQNPNQPLTLQALNLLLRREVGRNMTEADLAVRVERLGIAFDPAPDVVGRLRANGARQNLINAIKRAAEKVSANAVLGNTVTTTGAQPDAFIEEVRKVVREYVDELPDFICQQVVERYYDGDGSGAWERGDTLTYELTYNRKRESYKPINSVGRPVTKSLEEAGGAYSTGDFASRLAAIFDAETKAVFKAAGKERLGNRQTVLYDFRVPAESKTLTVKAEGAPAVIAGYSGTVWIDAESKRVLRIDQAVDDLPKGYPVTHSESSVDYDVIKLRGLDVDFLLPTRAEFIIGDRRMKQQSRNLLFFKFYRKFETDIKISDDPTPPNKPIP